MDHGRVWLGLCRYSFDRLAPFVVLAPVHLSIRGGDPGERRKRKRHQGEGRDHCPHSRRLSGHKLLGNAQEGGKTDGRENGEDQIRRYKVVVDVAYIILKCVEKPSEVQKAKQHDHSTILNE